METWLRRTRRELAVSGRLTEVGMQLDRTQPLQGIPWRSRLQSLLSGEWLPSPDDIIILDATLSKPRKKMTVAQETTMLLW